MGIESGDVIVEVDPVPADETIITIDPIELAPVDETIPADWTADGSGDLPPDVQTFGGPVDEAVDVAIDPVPVDELPVIPEDKTGELPDDGLIFTTTVIDGSAVDDAPVEDGPADSGSDDGLIFTTTVFDGTEIDDTGIEDTGIEDVPADGGMDPVIDRPVDPEPNWRTLDGIGDIDGDTGGDTGGGEIIGGEGGGTDDTPILDTDITDKDIADDTGTGDSGDPEVDVIYTLDPSDPLIYATTALDDTPGRPTDPLPFERTNAGPATDLAEPETASDVVHYAASEPFHTGLDLL